MGNLFPSPEHLGQKKSPGLLLTLFMPIKLRPTGGTSIFARKFKAASQRLGWNVTFKFAGRFDALLVIVSCPLRYLVLAKLLRRPIIQRLDGVYYPSTISGRFYPLYNLKARLIRRYFADFVIYQSHYSKSACDKFLGGPVKTPHQIIYNGVDTSHFCPPDLRQLPRSHADQQVFISASRFRRLDQVIPLVRSFQLYRQKYHANSRLYLVGNFESRLHSISRNLAHEPAVILTGPVPNTRLPEYLRSADVFLFTHQNPPCPNNVLEAMACGLPICGVADGAMPEITEPGVNCELVPVSGDAFHTSRRLDLAAFAANLNKIMSNRKKYAASSRQIALARFRLDEMVSRYLTAINQLVNF